MGHPWSRESVQLPRYEIGIRNRKPENNQTLEQRALKNNMNVTNIKNS